VVIAANAGGAWTPIGDVTTTMLWISGQISALATMKDVFLPAATSLLVPLAMLSSSPEFAQDEADSDSSRSALIAPSASNQRVVSDSLSDDEGTSAEEEAMAPRATLVLSAGLFSLIFVPIFKSATGLPPYLGMLAGLGALWVLTDAIHYGEPDRQQLKVPEALGRIDLQGILFFLGILLAISSLDSAGVLRQLASALDSVAPNVESVALAIGLVSAVIDNVPLVAATQGMYDMSVYPQDSPLWQLIAFCAGTGGSILIIGSAAGVAFMGLERASFEWYAKKVTPLALGGYLAGTAVYVGTSMLHSAQ
jgi:Na+/H+ antiporter NhaD/arsenite permease-like protein